MNTRDLNPKVTIVIPVYNGANYLSEAIESALAQTYRNIEIIVVDDGSNDGGATEKIATSYKDRIRYYKKDNGGVAAALNLGIKKMTGEYFSWLSHDDMYEKTKIEDQVNYLNKNNSEDTIVASQVKVLFASGIKKKENININTFKFIDIFLSTSAQVGLNGCSLLIPKKAFEICGAFDVNLPVTQDYDLWFRLKDRYKFVLLDKYLVISRRHAEQDSVQKQKLLLEAGDYLHYNFLCTISYDRFEEYFKNNKKNIKHAYDNYRVYKLRDYKKTASMLIKNILRYVHENDLEKFYDIYVTEIGIGSEPEGAATKYSKKGLMRNQSKNLSRTVRNNIEQEYNKLLRSGTNVYPIKASHVPEADQILVDEKRNAIRWFSDSVKSDGVYLTGEKILRKAYKKIK